MLAIRREMFIVYFFKAAEKRSEKLIFTMNPKKVKQKKIITS